MNWKEAKIKIADLESDNEKLIKAYDLLLKAIPVIHFKPEIIEVTDDKKRQVLELSIQGAATLLKTAFNICRLETHINGTVKFEDTNELFTLTFIKLPCAPSPSSQSS